MNNDVEMMWKRGHARQKAQLEALVLDRWGQSSHIAAEEMLSPAFAFFNNSLILHTSVELPLWTRLFFVDAVFNRVAQGWPEMFEQWSQAKPWTDIAWPWPSDPYEFEKSTQQTKSSHARNLVHGVSQKFASVVQGCLRPIDDPVATEKNSKLLDRLIEMASSAQKHAKTDQLAGLLVQAMLPLYTEGVLQPHQKKWFDDQHSVVFWDLYTRKVVGVPEMLLSTLVRQQLPLSQEHPYLELFWKTLQARSQDNPTQPSFVPSVMFITQWAEDQHPENKVFVDRLYFMANSNTWPWNKEENATTLPKRRL